MHPRPYQSQVIDAVERGWSEARRQLVVVPTGGGKTIIFAYLARNNPGKTLVLAHREELIEQAADKIHRTTGIRCAVEKADRWAPMDSRVVVASVQTMQGARLERWPAGHFSLLVCDEAHHAISDSWQRVLSRFRDRANILGVTATPDRGDKRDLGECFERVAAEIKLVDLIRDGYLAPITIRSIPLKVDLSAVKSTAGDLDASQLGSALDPVLPEIARVLKIHAAGRRTLAFLPLIDTSKKFVAACQAEGLRAEHVDGYDAERASKLERFGCWEWDVLSNAMLLTEGYDDPGIDCVLVLRPTRSRPLYSQMIGRGTRTEPLKKDLLILDLLWMHERHSLSRPAHLVASSEAEAEAITELSQEAAVRGGESQMDLLDAVEGASELRESKLAAELAKHAKKSSKYVSAEEFALRHHEIAVAEYEPELAWEKRDMTDKHRGALKRAGIDPESVRGRGHALKLLDINFRGQALILASDAQRKLLERFGHPAPETASLIEFRKFMAGLKQ